ncbi:hypothetical protein ACQKJC_22430 [Priestia koreensis]|uniref:hypothetical protein n=1 Tax=Priestia koreensis TaxID=284581 RepID=UPI003D04EA38
MNNLFTIFMAAFGLIISIKALVSKSDLEQVFLTQEQVIKLKFYRLIGLSASLGIVIADLYFLWLLIFKGKTFNTVDWSKIITISIIWSILGFLFFSVLSSILISIFTKYHYKYKVNLEGTGDLYILKMMNPDVCICSKDPNSEFTQDDIESYLLSIENLRHKPIIRMKFQRPQNSFQKLIRYNLPEN